MTGGAACPACGSNQTQVIYNLDSIPVQSCILLDTREEALAFPRGRLELAACEVCGFAFNAAFDPALVDYAASTEESQHFSGTFNRFAERLVDELAERYAMAGRQTLEVGCGKGDFLDALARRTGTLGLGIDPGVIPDRITRDGNGNPAFRREYFSASRVETPPDFILCRHTLEHIQDVHDFVEEIASVASGRPDVGVFFETPDFERVLTEGAFWDIYYEHCSYFTRASHGDLFRRAGFEIDEIRLDYDDQYIIQFASPRPVRSNCVDAGLVGAKDLMRAFPDRIDGTRRYWTDFVRTHHQAGRRVALWGGGSKAVSFLTTNGLDDEIDRVIDINPYKQGKFLPGTGRRVDPPDALIDDPPDQVIAMNAIYLDEIGAQLGQMGIGAELYGL